MKAPRIVTLEQLCLLPIGTVVSHLRTDKGRPINFDCQGSLLLDTPHRLTEVNYWGVELTSVYPGLRVNDGRVEAFQDSTTFMRLGATFPHRFVVWPPQN